MFRSLSRAHIALFSFALVNALVAQSPAPDATIDVPTRTITNSNFQVVWNTGADSEAITKLNWMGGSNMTGALNVDACGGDGNVAYFGNSLAPPDPGAGGLVLVGGGTITPVGTTPWSAQITVPAVEVTINSNSTSCPSSAGIDVQTTYRFFRSNDSRINWFQVQRVFDFTATTFPHDFRPYLPRLLMGSGYTQVIYPIANNELAIMNASDCDFGCTGPTSAPGAAPLDPAWDSTVGWFAINDPATGQGLVVSRVPSTNPQNTQIPAQLWIDWDAGPPSTNPSSFLLLSPANGFGGGLVTEAETLCFYDSAIWTPSVVPPVGCRNGLITLSPWILTFVGQVIATTSAPQTATLINLGTEPLPIVDIVSSGDFAQTNDCPKALAAKTACTITVSFTPSAAGIRSGSISILDERESSPQSLNLAGLGLSAQ
jgi:hypothetical protein